MSFKRRKLNSTSAKLRASWKSIAMVSLMAIKPIVATLKTWRIRHEKAEKQHQRERMLKRILLVCVAVFCIVLLGLGAVKALVSLKVLTVDSFTSMSAERAPVDEHGYTNVLLLGQGDNDHDGLDLTDTIIVASIDVRSDIVSLLSLPRDLQIRSRFLKDASVIDGRRINSLYRDYKGYIRYTNGDLSKKEASIEALTAMQKEIGDILELEIHHTIKVNFQAFTEAVDILGGVDIDVPYDIVDTTYPDNNYGYETFVIRKGPQTIDGETALKYARSRHTTSDFSRSARQQQLIRAMGAKAKNNGLLTNPSKLMKLWNTFNTNVETTMSLSQMIGMANLGRRFDALQTVAMQLNDNNGLYGVQLEQAGLLYTPPRDQFGGAAVLLPVSIPELPVTWKQIRVLSHLLFEERWLLASRPVIHILNAGAPSGSAGKLGREMKKYGFNIGLVRNASIEDREDSFVLSSASENRDYAAYLAKLLEADMRDQREDEALEPQETGDITLVLGEEYSFTHFQNLLNLPQPLP